jgi:hypothetical protein
MTVSRGLSGWFPRQYIEDVPLSGESTKHARLPQSYTVPRRPWRPHRQRHEAWAATCKVLRRSGRADYHLVSLLPYGILR